MSFLACWLKGIRSPQWPGEVCASNRMGMFVVSPGRSSSPSGTKTSRPAELKVAGTGSRNVPGGSLGVIVEPFSLPPLDSWTMDLGYERNRTICWMLIQSICCLENLPQLSRLLPPNWCYSCVFKRLFHLFVRSGASRWWEI